MTNFFELGQAHFWADATKLSIVGFYETFHENAAPSVKSDLWAEWASDFEFDYTEYEAGFASAWEEHDLQLDRVEKPWLFYDPCSWHGRAVSREIIWLIP
jgi:hypothetical protein